MNASEDKPLIATPAMITGISGVLATLQSACLAAENDLAKIQSRQPDLRPILGPIATRLGIAREKSLRDTPAIPSTRPLVARRSS